MIEFLNNDYDDVSAAVLEFAKEYIHVSINWNFQCFCYDNILYFLFSVWNDCHRKRPQQVPQDWYFIHSVCLWYQNVCI
jgi:hypothetical protein